MIHKTSGIKSPGELRYWLHPQRFDYVGLVWGSLSSISGDANRHSRLPKHGPRGTESGHWSPSREVLVEPLLDLGMSIKETTFLCSSKKNWPNFLCLLNFLVLKGFLAVREIHSSVPLTGDGFRILSVEQSQMLRLRLWVFLSYRAPPGEL